MNSDPTTPSRRPRTYLAIAAVAVAVAALAVGGYLFANRALNQQGNSATGPAGPTITLVGDLQLDGVVGPKWDTGATCWGNGGFADIREGAQVTVTDPTGKVLATGALAEGRVQPHPSIDGAKTCVFAFSVKSIPSGLTMYGVEVSHRGRMQYREVDLTQPLALSLG